MMLQENRKGTFTKQHSENIFSMLLRLLIILCYLQNILTMLYDDKWRICTKQYFENALKMLFIVFSHVTCRQPWRAKQRSKMAAHYGLSIEKQPSNHLGHLSAAEKERYKNKLEVLGTCDPHTTPAAVYKPLKTAMSLPKLEFGDGYIYLVENPSPTTAYNRVS